MKHKYYSHAPLLMSFGGIIGVFIIFVIYILVYDRNWWLFWLIIATLIFVACFRLGLSIKKLYFETTLDPLTGLFNRQYFYEKITYEVKRARRYKMDLSLIMIDVDDFKTVNDTWGHLEGDKVLVEISKVFKSHIRSVDVICRWGGEEFAIILPETDTVGAYKLSERIRKTIEKIDFGYGYKVTVCIGGATIKDEMNIKEFIETSDNALYKAKKNFNKNTVVILAE